MFTETNVMIYTVAFLISLLLILRRKRQAKVVAFFHPYCNAGGGGERVLWCAVRAMQKKWPDYKYMVYSGDITASKEQILMKAKQRFGIEVDPSNVEFVFLRLRRLVEADLYPRFTLLLQTIAGFFLGLEALWKVNPEIFIDSMGYPFCLPLFKWIAGSKVVAYVHYPTISCDMIHLVERREASYNNSDVIAQSGVLSHLKLLYYRLFAFVYGLAGKACDAVMVNGSWTSGHITRIWKRSDAKIVFPPCDVSNFLMLEQSAEERLSKDDVIRILSIGQIRPEKNHLLQLEVLKDVLAELEKDGSGRTAQLTIAGGCRNKEDRDRVKHLQATAADMGIQDSVSWKLNVPFDELLEELSQSLMSIHTMWNEHFGISVVEGMAAGTVMIAHDSGGPQLDIVVAPKNKKGGSQAVGFLAASKEEFVKCVLHVAGMSRVERDKLRQAARTSMARFSEEQFDVNWIEVMQTVVCQ